MMKLFTFVLSTGYPGIMGILRETLNPSTDVRIEKLRYIETLKEAKPEGISFLQHLTNFIHSAINTIFSLIFLIAASPILLIVAIWIKLDSPGPVFFRQERMGEGGRIFRITKFRTMISDAEKQTGPILARKDDDRITRAGQVLRHLRIDEIPQMFNVLAGQMALVGPRPERPEIYDNIVKDWPEFFKRLEAKPGITGLAQIRGGYHTDPRDKLRYDLLYIKRRTLWLDLKIIAITAYICLLKKGAC